MEITNVNITKIIQKDTRLRGMATIILNDEIAINNIRIIEGNNGLFVAMPSRKDQDGKFVDIIHPIKKETRELIHNVILKKYNENN